MNTATLTSPSTFFNIDNMKSYATEENLVKALNKLFDEQSIRRALVVCNRAGRFTAIFPGSSAGPDLARFARHGIMTIG